MYIKDITIIFHLIFLFLTSSTYPITQIINVKVNKEGSVIIFNNKVSIINPHKIYEGQTIKDYHKNCISVNNKEEIIRLEWDNTHITSCAYMFSELEDIIEVDLSLFDSSYVNDMSHMFEKSKNLKSIIFGNLNTTNVIKMNNIFAGCNSLTSLDISSFQTSKVEDMSYMFYDCYSLTSLGLKKLKTNSSYIFKEMFFNCYSLKSLDLSSFDTNRLTSLNFQYMFYNCTSLTSLNISNFVTVSASLEMEGMFANCKNLGYLNFEQLNESGKEHFSYNNTFENTPKNMVICLQEHGASIINENFETKNCSIIDCTENWKEKQKLINDEDGNCVPDCGNMFKYLNRCYRQCPEGTYNTGVNNVCEEIKEINNNTNEASIE